MSVVPSKRNDPLIVARPISYLELTESDLIYILLSYVRLIAFNVYITRCFRAWIVLHCATK